MSKVDRTPAPLPKLSRAKNESALHITSLIIFQDDRLMWKSLPSRQLSRQKRVEYESDVRERFYDDYLGNRTSNKHAVAYQFTDTLLFF